jgi:hypothetical protein
MHHDVWPIMRQVGREGRDSFLRRERFTPMVSGGDAGRKVEGWLGINHLPQVLAPQAWQHVLLDRF